MERTIIIDGEIRSVPEPISPEGQREAIADLIKASRINSTNLRLDVMARFRDMVVISFRSTNSGVFLLFASTKEEITESEKMGLIMPYPGMEMALSKQRATFWEINRKLPAHLRKYYPEIAQALPKEKQKITHTQNTRVA